MSANTANTEVPVPPLQVFTPLARPLKVGKKRKGQRDPAPTWVGGHWLRDVNVPDMDDAYAIIQSLAGEELEVNAMSIASDVVVSYWYQLWKELEDVKAEWSIVNLIRAGGHFEMLHSMMTYESILSETGAHTLQNAMETIVAWRLKGLIAAMTQNGQMPKIDMAGLYPQPVPGGSGQMALH